MLLAMSRGILRLQLDLLHLKSVKSISCYSTVLLSSPTGRIHDRLYDAVLPNPSPLDLLRPSTCGSSLFLGSPTGLRFFASHLHPDRQPNGIAGAFRCSISQVHSYGTVNQVQKIPLKWNMLYRKISLMDKTNDSSSTILEHWEKEEQELSKFVLSRVIKELRRFGRSNRALEVYDWMKSHGDRFTFDSGDHAIQLDLIGKVHGISSAEEYFSNLPASFKDKRTYGALLNAYGKAKMREKAEATLESMKAEGFGYDVLPFNVMMTLYMNIEDHNKVVAMINEMKEKNLPLDLYSYNIWITSCAATGDVIGMEKVVQEMVADTRVNANWNIYSTLAAMYIRLHDFDKALNCLEDVERRMTGTDRRPFTFLFGLYSSIGKKDEVHRIWKRYKSIFHGIINTDYLLMLSSLAKLGDSEGIEKIYGEWLSNASLLDARICNNVMAYYLREGSVSNAKKTINGFLERGGMPKPWSWEILAAGYLKEKQVPEALSCMEAAASCKGDVSWKPKLSDVANFLALCREQDKKESELSLIDVLQRTGSLENEEYKSLVAQH